MKNTNKLLAVLLAFTIAVSGIVITTMTTNAVEGTEGLNTQAWTFPADQYGALMGNGAHGTNGDTIKATVDAGTNLTAMDFAAISGVNAVGNADWYVIKYTGVMVAEESGWYQLSARKVDNGYVAYVAGEKVFDMAKHASWIDNGAVMYCGEKMYLEAGVKYAYEAYFVEQDGGDALDVKVLLADGSEKSFADAGIKFYADVAADEATLNIDNTAPALDATEENILYYNNFEGTPLFMDGDDSVQIGTSILEGKTDVSIEFVVKLVDANRGGITNHAGFAGIGTNADTNWVVMGYRDYGAIKFGMRTVDAEVGAGDSGKTADSLFHSGIWYTIKYTFSATTVKAYIDGTEVGSWDVSGQKTIGEIEGDFVFGKELKWNDPGFKGYVSEIRVTTTEEVEEDGSGNKDDEENEENEETIDAYAQNMFGLVVKDSYDDTDGVAVPDNPGDNTNGIGNIHNNAWVKVPAVAFGNDGATSITLKYCAKESRMGENGKVAIWIGGMTEQDGTLIGEVDLPITGTEYSQFSVVTEDLLSVVTGTQDVYFVFTADTTTDKPYVANMSYFQFNATASDDDGNQGDDGDGEEEIVLVEGLNAQAWSFAGDEANYKALFGDLVIGKNGDIVKAAVAAGTGLTVRDCQAIVAADYVIDGDNYVIKYNGVMTVAEDGWYQFATSKIDNGYVAYVGGVKVLDYVIWNWWNDSGNDVCYGQTIYLEAGVKYAYEAYFVEQGGGQVIIPQVVKADGNLYNYADAGFKFYANDTAENVAPAKWEDVEHVMSGMTGINGSEGVTEANGTINLPATATGQLWNYTWHGYTADSVVKVAWYITVDSVSDDVDPDASNITFDNNFFVEDFVEDVNGLLDIPNSVFTENVGKNIIVVGVFNQPSTGLEARWNLVAPGIGFTVNKVVVGNADANFETAAAKMGGYTLVFEEANSEDVVFTPSDASNADDTPSGKPITGDVASVVAILVAGAAALGGVKMKKRSK